MTYLGMTIPTRAKPAWGDLNRALDAADEAGDKIPCRDSKHPEWWTSDTGEEREAAAHQCAGCAVRALCSDYANQAAEAWGVYGGIDRAKLGRRNKRINEEDAAA